MKHWYAVFTKPNKEALAEEHLLRQEIETYLPLVNEKRRKRGKWVECTLAMFPRYLFVNMDVTLQSTASIRSTVGVIGLVRFGGEPARVPGELIERLVSRTDSATGLINIDKPQFETGQKVLIQDGPFKDIQGIFQQSSGKDRAMILLDLLGRKNVVLVDKDLLAGAV